jgi:hypothetical protein
MNIDVHSLTWKEIVKFIGSERQDAIQMLIADKNSEQQRGALIVLDRLEALALSEDDQPNE